MTVTTYSINVLATMVDELTLATMQFVYFVQILASGINLNVCHMFLILTLYISIMKPSSISILGIFLYVFREEFEPFVWVDALKSVTGFVVTETYMYIFYRLILIYMEYDQNQSLLWKMVKVGSHFSTVYIRLYYGVGFALPYHLVWNYSFFFLGNFVLYLEGKKLMMSAEAAKTQLDQNINDYRQQQYIDLARQYREMKPETRKQRFERLKQHIADLRSINQEHYDRITAPMFPTMHGYMSSIYTTVASVDLKDLKVVFDYIFKDSTADMTQFSLAFLSLFYRIYRMENLADFFFAALDFVKSIFPIDFLIDKAKKVYEYLRDSVTRLYNRLLASPLVSSEGLADVLVSIRSKLNLMLNSDIVTSIRDFVLSLVSLKIFSKDTNVNITSLLGPAKACTGIQLVETTLDFAVSMLNAGDRLGRCSSLGEIFTTEDPILAFTTVSDELYSLKDLTYCGLPVEGKVDRRQYLSRVVSIVKDGEALLQSLPAASKNRFTVDASLRQMRLIKAQFLNRMSAETRQAPFCVCVEGNPGIGKGVLVDYFGMVWSAVKDRPYESTHVYHRDATEEYWSGYEPLSQPIIHYSEPGSLNRNIAKMRGDPTMTEFLSVSDNLPKMCNMAAVEDKGKIFALPELLVMDCNDPTMNLDVLVNNPAAVRRRILYVTPTVKPNFVKEGTCKMDQAKSIASTEPILDRWTFDVYKLEPSDAKNSNTVTLMRKGTIYELTALLENLYSTHIEQQTHRVNMMKEIEIRDYFPPNEEILLQPNPFDEIALEVEPQSESMVLTKMSITYRAYKFLLWDNCPYYRHVFYDIIKNGLPLIYYCILVIMLYLVQGVIWFFLPHNFIFKLMVTKPIIQKMNYQLYVCDYYWLRLQDSVGIKTSRPVPVTFKTADYIKYAIVFTGLLALCKGYSAVKLMSEGDMISSSKERNFDEVRQELKEIQEKSKCELPPVKLKQTNGIDWDATQKMRPIPVMINSVQQNRPNDVITAIENNVRYLTILGKHEVSAICTGVCSDIAFMNRHCLGHPDKEGKWQVTLAVDQLFQTGVRKITIRDNEFVSYKGDIILIRLRGAKFKDIRPYIPTQYVPTPIFGHGGTIANTNVVIKQMNSVRVSDEHYGDFMLVEPYTYGWPEHRKGMCGTPLIMNYNGATGLVGIHCAGSTSPFGYAENVGDKNLESCLKQLSYSSATLGVNSEGKFRFPKRITNVIEVTHRSPLRYEECPGLDVYGGLEGYNALRPGKSELRSSEFIHCAEELTGVSPFDEEGKPLFAAPIMTHRIVDGEYVAPYNHFVKKAGVIKKSLDPKKIRIVIDLLFNRITTMLESRGVTSLSPVPLEVAQNGYPKNFYMRAMKPSTSGGWAWPGKKSKYTEDVELDFKETAVMPLFDVQEQVLEQINAYANDLDALPLLGAQLKDEPRAYDKVRLCKTRVFCMSPYESTLINRMYLMPFYTQMVEHGDIFCTAIGINMHSTDVDDFVNRLTSFSDKFMEGDYGGFDTSMPYDIGLAANTIVYRVLKHFGYDETALQIVKGIFSDNLYPTVIMSGDVFAAPALQPSGKYATAEDNSLRGLVMLVYAWLELTDKVFQPEDFFTLVNPVIYGDDLVAAVKPAAREYFNNNSYQYLCDRVYGVEFTNAQKTSTMADFLSFGEISFLKRKFVFREDLNHWTAPLGRESIMKTICYYLPSSNVTKEEQLIDSCISALRELFFHETEIPYNELRIKFAKRCAEYFERDSDDILSLFPSFGQIEAQLYEQNFQPDLLPSVSHDGSEDLNASP